MKKKKVLLITGGDMVNRGVESFLIKWIRNAPKNIYHFDLYIPGRIKSQDMADKFISEGVYLISEKDNDSAGKISKYLKIIKKLTTILQKNQYDIIHINTGNMIVITLAVFAAKRCGYAEKCIVHSHNAVIVTNVYKKIAYSIMRCYIARNVTICAACSRKAAEYLFGTKKANKSIIINNYIDTTIFRYSSQYRDEYRKQLGIENEILIGHIGAFEAQKNHNFLIQAFYSAYCENPNIRLLLIGNGSLEETIKDKLQKLHLTERVIHIKKTDEVQKYMCAMDVFVLPSLFEGLPIVGIEAQSCGLPCIFSESITQETALCNNVNFLPLTNSELWGKHMIKSGTQKQNRENSWTIVKEKGYDISSMSNEINMLYGCI